MWPYIIHSIRWIFVNLQSWFYDFCFRIWIDLVWSICFEDGIRCDWLFLRVENRWSWRLVDYRRGRDVSITFTLFIINLYFQITSIWLFKIKNILLTSIGFYRLLLISFESKLFFHIRKGLLDLFIFQLHLMKRFLFNILLRRLIITSATSIHLRWI